MKKPFKKYPSKHEERLFHGWNACYAIYKERPGDILKIYVQKERALDAKVLSQFASSRNIPFSVVATGDLENITEASHHEGLAMLAKVKRPYSQDALFERVKQGLGTKLYLALDGVVNPHNVGAILRTAAHFGVGAVLVNDEKGPKLSPSMIRIAEGGAEYVPLVRVKSMEFALTKLRNLNYQIIAADQKESKASHKISKTQPKVLVMGSERSGLTPSVQALCEYQLAIPGTGKVESLNVSVAAGILMASLV